MAQFRVGCVPYVNARPLVAAFDQPNEFVEVVYDVPSKLPALLDAGEVDAILVSSIELLRRSDLLPIDSIGIFSNGPVRSVRLLSKVSLEEIKTLALDRNSMTSNVLAQVILAERGVFPTTEEMNPCVNDMLATHDACVIIGDLGFEADASGLIDLDLGNAWTEMTGLPFVWALWLGKSNIPLNGSLLASLLHSAYVASGFSCLQDAIMLGKMTGRGHEEEQEFDESNEAEVVARRNLVIQSAVARSTWTFEQVESYLTHNVRFDHFLFPEALQEFADMINKHGFGPVQVPLALRHEDILDSVTKLFPVLAKGD